MNLRRLLAALLGGILAVFGLIFSIQNLGLNWNLLVGLIVLIVGIWLLLGLPIIL
jgi:hypothetical protein